MLAPHRPRALAARRIAAALAIGLVLVLTLWPVDAHGTRVTQNCIICGDRGVADALLNVLLFTPLGVAVALQGWRRRHALMTAATLSALVELAQVVVPGRDPGLGDLLFNSIGGVLGVLAWRHLARVTRAPRPADDLAGPVAGLLVVAWLATSAWGFGAALPTARVASLWTPDFAHVERYTGRVDSARLGGMPIPHATELDPERLRRRFEAGDTIVVSGVAGRTPSYLSPVLAIVDFDGNEVVTVGFNRRDLVLRYRLRSTGVRLSQPGVRWHDAAATLRAGQPLVIRAQRRARDVCLTLGTQERCGLGYDLPGSWRLLMDLATLAPGLRRLLGLAWLAALALPVGFLARTWPVAAASLVPVLAALVVLPAVAGLLSTPPLAHAAVVIGGAAGTWLRQRVARAVAAQGM